MLLFLIGCIILVLGYILYGSFIEKIFEPDDRKTPAFLLEDGVDYVPMDISQNSLVQLLNIAGTGPIFGPIAGALWGPIVFILIPIGNILAGAVHDYLSAMISVRENGATMPIILRKFLGNKCYHIFNIFLLVLLILIAAVFITIPVDIILYNYFDIHSKTGLKELFTAPTIYIFLAILFYNVLAIISPVDKFLGKLYPIFGATLLISSIGVFVAFFKEDGWFKTLNEFGRLSNISLNGHPQGLPLFPLFFTTVACGILSGFHSAQSPIITRTLSHEKDGKIVFFGMMVLEGFVAMIWAAGGVIARNLLGTTGGSSIIVVDVAHAALPSILGPIAVIGLIVLPITSGDTALRGARIVYSNYMNIEQKTISDRLLLSLPLIAITIFIVIWGKIDASGFDTLWRYFAWANQTTAVFILFTISAYIFIKFPNKKTYLVSLLPAIFYCVVVTSYFFGGNATREIARANGKPPILNKSNEIGFMLGYTDNALITYGLAIVLTLLLVVLFFIHVNKLSKDSNFKIN